MPSSTSRKTGKCIAGDDSGSLICLESSKCEINPTWRLNINKEINKIDITGSYSE